MPFKSDRQRRYVEGLAHGNIAPRKGGMSKEEAKQFASHSEGKKPAPRPAPRKKGGK